MFLPSVTNYIVKLADDCNLACHYCYHFRGKKEVKVPVMDIPLLESLIEQASQLAPYVWFVWHGGEPLLAGKDTFRTIVDVQEHCSKHHGTVFRNSVQTNGTLLDGEWCLFFEKHQFGVGISLDGPEDLHNAYRPYRNGRGSFSAVMRGWSILVAAGNKAGALAVVTKGSLGRGEEILQFFLERGIQSFNLLPCMEVDKSVGELTVYSVQPYEYAQFICRVYDLLVERDDPSIKVSVIFDTLVALLGGWTADCRLNGRCGIYVTVEPDGTVWPCDNFVGIADFRFGKLRDQPLAEILDGANRARFKSRIESRNAACRSCKWRSACKGGCTWRMYQSTLLGLSGDGYHCGANRIIFDHIAKHLESTVPGYRHPGRSSLEAC